MAASRLMMPTAIAITILLLISPRGCDAHTSFKPLLNNQTSVAGNYLIRDEDIETELLMESHVSRMLAGSQNSQTSNTNDANKASVGGCERPPRYDSCLGPKNNNPRPDSCGTFNRAKPC